MPVFKKNLLMLEDVSNAPGSSWSAERSALAAVALQKSGYLRLRVHGESMLPAIWPGHVIEIASCSLADVRPGEIVLAQRDGRLFLHRFVRSRFDARVSAVEFLLRGDSMPDCDPPFPAHSLLGRLATSPQKVDSAMPSPAGSATNLSGKLHLSKTWLQSTWLGAKCSRLVGAFLCHCSLARRALLRFHRYRQAALPPTTDLCSEAPIAL
jgi:hypothetical protein